MGGGKERDRTKTINCICKKYTRTKTIDLSKKGGRRG